MAYNTNPENASECMADASGAKYQDGKLLAFRNTRLEDYTVAEGTEIICDKAFAMSRLREIILPSSIKAIGRDAFSYSRQLEKLNIPESITEIREGTFRGCELLSVIELPSSITKIEKAAFGKGLVTLILNGNNVQFDRNALSFAHDLSLLIVPDDSVEYYKGIMKALKKDIDIEGKSTAVIRTSVDYDDDIEEDSDIEDNVEDDIVSDLGNNSINITAREISHTLTIDDSRFAPRPVLTLTPAGKKPKAFIIKSKFDNIIKDKTEAYLKTVKSPDETVVYQIDKVSTNVPELNNLSETDLDLYAFAIIKLYNNALCARQENPAIDLNVNLTINNSSSEDEITFVLSDGNVTNVELKKKDRAVVDTDTNKANHRAKTILPSKDEKRSISSDEDIDYLSSPEYRELEEKAQMELYKAYNNNAGCLFGPIAQIIHAFKANKSAMNKSRKR